MANGTCHHGPGEGYVVDQVTVRTVRPAGGLAQTGGRRPKEEKTLRGKKNQYGDAEPQRRPIRKDKSFKGGPQLPADKGYGFLG